MATKIEPLLTTAEVAEILRVPPRMVPRIRELRVLARNIGRRLRWSRADVERYLESAQGARP